MIYWPGTDIVKSQGNAFTAHLHGRQEPVATGLYRGCRSCGQDKPASAFYERNKSTCSDCLIARDDERRKRIKQEGVSRDAVHEKRRLGPKLDLAPRRSVAWKAPHGGAYSKANASEKSHG